MTRPLLRTLAVLLAGLALLLGFGAPAAAHGGEGQAEVTSLGRDGDQVTVVIRLTWVGDSDGVPNATVTAVVGDATPVPMTAGAAPGDYTVTLAAAPGETIQITSASPAVTVEVPAPDAAPVETTAPAETTTTETTTTETAPTTTEATTGTDATTDPDTEAEAADGSDDDNSTLLVVGVMGLLAVAIAGAVVVMWKKPAPGPVAGDDGGPGRSDRV